MEERIRQFAERHRLFCPNRPLGVAVSGGADSLCLLHILGALAPLWNFTLHVVHLNHNLRGAASHADAEFVREAAAALNLTFHLRQAHLPADENMEQAARQARHAFFRDLIASGTVDRVATGHTRSDQAETVLYRLFRGSGLSGLTGILPITAEGLVRPLLDVDRAEIEAWLGERKIPWREDATNQDQAFARNRLRHGILPQLRDAFNPRISEVLAHLATLAQDEEDYWKTQISVPFPRNQAVYLSVPQLAAQPAVGRRTIRAAIRAVKGDLRQIDFAHIETVLEIARSAQGSGRVQIPGVDIFRSFQSIRVAPSGYDYGRPRDFSFPVLVPGTVNLPGDAGSVKFELISDEKSDSARDKVRDELDWRTVTTFPLGDDFKQDSPDSAANGVLPDCQLRNWMPGDAYQPYGESRAVKIKDLFQQARVPLWERRYWPVLERRGQILWSARFGSVANLVPLPGEPRIRITVTPESGLDI